MSIELNNVLDLETPGLAAYEIAEKDYPTLKKIVSIWGEVASKRRGEPIFGDSEAALIMVLSGFRSKDPSFQMFVCRDSKGEPQAFMRTYNNGYCLEIMALAANPINIGIGQDRQLRGAGSCLLAKAEEVARSRKIEAIRLFSLSSSLGFYMKKGFLVEDSTNLELFKLLSKKSEEADNVG